LWLELATHANEMAALLHRRAATIEAVALDQPPSVNSLFPRLPAPAIEPLREWCFFWDWDVSSHQVRWMTAWDTTADDVEVFSDGVAKILATCN
jgi:threonine aldolase